MTLIVDSNIVAALVLPVAYTPAALRLMTEWREAEERFLAPMLFEYEIATIVRRSVVLSQLPPTQIPGILGRLLSFGVSTIAPTPELHLDAVRLAERIGQNKAYDGHYLALAARESAPFWTADRRLAAAAQGAGLPWVRWIGKETTA